MFYGADTEALRQHADAVTRAAHRLRGLGADLAGVIASVEWVGGDAEAFRGHGRQVLDQQLAAVTDSVIARGDELVAHADEQDVASGGGGDPGAPPGDDNPFWFWQDGWSAPWSDKADILDDIPLDKDQFGIEAMGQEGFPNCITVSSLAAMAESDPEFFAEHVRRIGDEHYEVDLFIDGQWKTVTVQDEVHQSGSRDDGRQNWLTLYEQALIQEGILDEDGSYSNDRAVTVFEAVTGAEGMRHVGRPGQYAGVAPALSYEEAVQAFEEGRAVVLGTPTYTVESSDGSIQLVENHAYAIESVNPDGTITVVNPWGEDARFRDEDGGYRTTVTREQFGQFFDDSHVSAPPEDWDRTGG